MDNESNLKWFDCLPNDDTASLRAIFGETMLSTNQVDIRKISFDRDGPSISFDIDIDDFPKSPPSKWIANQYNRVTLILVATGVRKLLVQNISTKLNATLGIYNLDGLLRLQVKNSPMELDLLADFIYIKQIGAYHDAR
jgi:Immunity protein 50